MLRIEKSVYKKYLSTPLASKVHCSINGLENSSSPKYSKVQHLFGIAVGLFSAGVGLFSATVGLRKSPPPAKKSPTPTEKSPTVISKRCWTLEYSGELEFSSPFTEQWTLDTRGVLYILIQFDGADAIFILVPLPQGRECKGKHSIPVCRVRGLPEREF